MYQIRMTENKDFSEKKCFLSGEVFRPGKMIATLEKKCKSNFRPVGFISPSGIKTFDYWSKLVFPIPMIIDLGYFPRGMSRLEIRNMLRQFDKYAEPVNKAVSKIGIKKLATLSLEQYHDALRSHGIKC
ncbi:MAG: hypothetical protein PH343_07260 [Nitrospira sp.]|nr:hypothetical protein [Nitrospira sp.]